MLSVAGLVIFVNVMSMVYLFVGKIRFKLKVRKAKKAKKRIMKRRMVRASKEIELGERDSESPSVSSGESNELDYAIG